MRVVHSALEQAYIQHVAEDYRSRGYEVIIEPHQLPDFLSGYRPDMMVSRGGETTVIEVKSRPSRSDGVQTRKLAELLAGKPGWNFELIVVSDDSTAPFGTRTFDYDDVRRSVKEVRELVASGFTGPALLTGWAALEAALRLLLDAEGVTLRSAPSSVVKQGVEEGLISRDEYQTLSDVMARRNALAHGFQGKEVKPEDVSVLLGLAERLLAETSLLESA